MLKGNLGESDIPSHEILYDANQLRSLAQLQESLVTYLMDRVLSCSVLLWTRLSSFRNLVTKSAKTQQQYRVARMSTG